MKKHLLITGSTDGIGKGVAGKLAAEGHDLYLHGRNKAKLDQTIADIKTRSGNPNIQGFVADLSVLSQVKSLAQQILDVVPVLDVLINNAGVYHGSGNNQRLDLRMTVNYFVPYVLTHSLAPALQNSSRARIVNVSSAAQAPVSLAALSGTESLSVQAGYAQSKLALIMWSFDLARKLKSSNVIAVNPGSLLDTKMAQEAFGQVWSPAAKGVDILYDLATAPEYGNVTGVYFDNDKGSFSSAHPDAYDSDKIERMLLITESTIATS